jgi:hypothetical protein
MMTSKFYLCCLLAFSALSAAGQTKSDNMEKVAKPITCKLTTPELQKRKATVIAELKALVLTRKDLVNGFAYEFIATDEILDQLNIFIKTERMCCDFFTFQLTIEDDLASLHITGPDGAKEYLKEEVDL